MTLATRFVLAIDGFGSTWTVERLEGHEQIHAPFSFKATCAPPSRDARPVAPDTFLALLARLSWPMGDGSERVLSGLIDRAEAVHGGYRFTLVPLAAELADAVDHHVFLGKDTVTIVEEVLARRHLRVERRLSRVLPPRAQCVQHFESDLAFVSRLLAEEGIAWWSKPGQGDTLVLSDNPSAYDDIPGVSALRVADDAGLVGEEAVGRIRLRAGVVADKVSTREYDFEHPDLDQTAEAGDGGRGLEVFAYPGGYADPSLGHTLAAIRLQEARAEHLMLEAETSCRRLAAGHVLSLTHGARGDLNQRWLLVEVRHVLVEKGYVARFRAVPAASGYRPPRPKPVHLGGVQTATITGPVGTEIHTEAHGRVRAQLRWDRRTERDEKSSHWMRVVQPPISGGFLLPRSGWEVLLGFSGPSADARFVLGRIPNGAAPPPSALPAHKVVSAFGSRTTPRGGSGNVLQLDDAAGREAMGLAASADYNERTENDKVTGVVGSDTSTIGGSHKLVVGTVHEVSVSGAQLCTVGGSRAVNVNANKAITAASEAVTIGGARTFTIGGDQTTSCGGALVRAVGGAKAEAPIEHQSRSVTGCSTIMVGGMWKVVAGAHAGVSVLGTSNEQIGGAKNIVCGKYDLAVTGALSETIASRSIRASGDRGEQFGASATYAISGAAKLSGADVVVKATSRITLKAGGATITLTPGSITIDASFDGTVASVDHGDEAYG